MSDPKVKIILDSSELEAAMREVSAFTELADSLDELRQLLLAAFEVPSELGSLHTEAAGGAEIRTRFELGDRLSAFLSALRASEVYALIVERAGQSKLAPARKGKAK